MSRLAVPKMVKHSRRMSQQAVGGLDADLKARENAKRDGGLESDCCAFLTALTGIEVNDMMEDLKVSKTDPLVNDGGSEVSLPTTAASTLLVLPPLFLLTRPVFLFVLALPPVPAGHRTVSSCAKPSMPFNPKQYEKSTSPKCLSSKWKTFPILSKRVEK